MDHPSRETHPEAPADRFRAAIKHAAHLLPAQGPITVFIHHNTLHAFEDRPFDTAVAEGAAVFGCEPYLTEDRFRAALGRGRIRFADLREVLADDLGDRAHEALKPHGTRLDLRLAMLQYPLASGTADELRWLIAETDALGRVRPEASAASRGRLVSEARRWVMRDLRGRNGANPDWVRGLFDRFGLADIEAWSEPTWEAFALEALWAVCREGARSAPDPAPAGSPAIRHRDLLVRAGADDTDPWVHDVLIRFTAAFLDQGVSHWPLPGSEFGYFTAFCSLYSRAAGPPNRWMRGLAAEAKGLLAEGTDPVTSACASLAALGVPPDEWDAFIGATLLPLRGWAGMVHQVETRGDRVAHPVPVGSLNEFVAVRLLLERFAVPFAAREGLRYTGPLAALREHLRASAPPAPRRSDEERAFPVFQLAQLLGWAPGELTALAPKEWGALFAEIDGFPAVERRRTFHLAYERRFREQCLDALALHAPQKPKAPRFQTIACLDEREESFRRHLEEVAPDCETFGAAGFFAVPMYYKGAGDAHFVPLCPIVLTPGHWVEERPASEEEDRYRRLTQTRRLLGSVSHRAHVGTRTFAIGALLTATVGVLASVPLVLRILLPRLTARLRGQVGRFVVREARTKLDLERPPECAPANRPGHRGFTVTEMTAQAERLLRDIGLTGGFARLVFVIGHGSNSFNNPHKSAYDCGACGGSSGAPNGRAAAEMLNDPRVR
ncbi:MAG TPA: putative inorganic carbon transporter subunit DabA, partial [Gemmata sp.]